MKSSRKILNIEIEDQAINSAIGLYTETAENKVHVAVDPDSTDPWSFHEVGLLSHETKYLEGEKGYRSVAKDDVKNVAKLLEENTTKASPQRRMIFKTNDFETEHPGYLGVTQQYFIDSAQKSFDPGMPDECLETTSITMLFPIDYADYSFDVETTSINNHKKMNEVL